MYNVNEVRDVRINFKYFIVYIKFMTVKFDFRENIKSFTVILRLRFPRPRKCIFYFYYYVVFGIPNVRL